MNPYRKRRPGFAIIASALLAMLMTACSGNPGNVVRVDTGNSQGGGTSSRGSGNSQGPAPHSLTVQTVPSDGGNVFSNPAGVACGSVCKVDFVSGTVVGLAVNPATGFTFAGWGGACNGIGSCRVNLSSDQSVIANFKPIGQYVVSLTRLGNGSGTISSTPTGINCGTVCSASFVAGSKVTLSAAAAQGSSFAGWSGSACVGTAPCTLTVNSDTAIGGTFVPGVTLTVTTAGSGTGSVTSWPSGINCPSSCSNSFGSGSVVSLAATPSPNSVFTGWGGACSGTGSCAVTLNSVQNVIANFGPAPPPQSFTLTVHNTSGVATGTIISSPGAINCGSVCSDTFSSGTSVLLTATPAPGYSFGGWSGSACVGTNQCTVMLNSDVSVDAAFQPQHLLSVSLAGTGSGSVTSDPTGISCGPTCSSGFPSGTVVALAATPNTDSVFAGWGGACSGEGACAPKLDSDETVIATFNSLTTDQYTLSISPSGNGNGSVTSSPVGIDCGFTCSASFQSGTAVTLTAAAAPGSAFAGWDSPYCLGTDPCTVTVTSSTSIGAIFVPVYPLTVSTGGGGLGSVTSDPPGINCPSSCAANFSAQTPVTLVAIPESGFGFNGWSGACTGVGKCTVLMTGPQSVSADFEPTKTQAAPFLTITPSPVSFGSVQIGTTAKQVVQLSDTGGDGSGTLTVTDANIDNGVFTIAPSQFPINLNPGESANLTIGFTPNAVGLASATVSFNSNGSNTPTALSVSGNGSTSVGGSGTLNVNPPTLYFGNVNIGNEVTQTVTMSNLGSGNTIVSAASVTGSGFTIDSPSFPLTLTPGSSQPVTITFAPQDSGTVVGVITFTSDAQGSPVISLVASGNGNEPVTSATAVPSDVSFGNVTLGTTSYQEIIVYNTGNTPVTVNSAGITGAGFNLNPVSFPITIPVNGFESFIVSFAPLSLGGASGNITFNTDAQGNPPVSTLSGTGITMGSHSANLLWNFSTSDVALYQIYRGNTSGGPYALVGVVLGTMNSFNDYTISGATTYYYVVTAVGSNGYTSIYSNEAVAVVP